MSGHVWSSQCQSKIFGASEGNVQYSGHVGDLVRKAFKDSKLPYTLDAMLSLTSPSPFVWTPELCQQLADINEAIYIGLQHIIRRWPRDEQLQQHLNLPERIRKLFVQQWADLPDDQDIPLGTLRPDVLFGQDGQLHVCEINCRFPLNGFLITWAMNNAMHEAVMSPDSCLSNFNISASSAIMTLVQDVKNRFTASFPVWLIRGKETTHDTGLFAYFTELETRECKPEELQADEDGNIFVFDGQTRYAMEQCVLELHQDEILCLNDDVIRGLALLSSRKKCLNDIRTIFLAHDKVMLNCLRRYSSHLGKHYEGILKRYIIPTFRFEHCLNIPGDLLPHGAILKPRGGGKGEGVVITTSTEGDYLEKLQPDLLPGADYVVQPLISQQEFKILDANFVEKSLQTVGTFLSLDGQFYGPALNRSANTEIINLSSGGTALFPAITVGCCPQQSRLFAPLLKCVDGNKVRRALAEDGVALIGTSSPLGDKDEFLEMIQKRLNGMPRRHSDKDDFVWDVHPQSSANGHVARSHTKLRFDVHTDATFEDPPPRYVALSVVRADKTHHGIFGMASIAKSVQNLSEDDIDTLQKTLVKWKVPPEFRKGDSDHIFGSVLLSDSRARLRRDSIITAHLPTETAQKFWRTFDRFEELLRNECDANSMVVPERCVLLTDNHRFAHARGMIVDSQRYLQRIRFDLPNSPELDRVLLSASNHPILNSPLSDDVLNLQSWPVISKETLLTQIDKHFATYYYSKGGLYWSPAGGTTVKSGGSSTVQAVVPRTNSECSSMRIKLRRLLKAENVLLDETVALNIFASGNLIRSMEVLGEVLVGANATHLPLGASATDEQILEAIERFGVNTIVGWGTRILQLVITCTSQKRTLSTVRRIIHGGETLDTKQRKFIKSVCHPDAQLFGIYGSAEAGVFAVGRGDDNREIYSIAPDSVYVEILQLDSNVHVEPGSPGRLVLTNLVRTKHPLVRFDTGDLVVAVDDKFDKIEVLGRVPGSTSMPFGSKFVAWDEVASVIANSMEEHYTDISWAMFQLWVDKEPETVKSIVTVAMVDSAEGDSSDLAKALDQACRNLKINVFTADTNVSYVGYAIVPSAGKLYRSPRSSKLQQFVDRRQRRINS